MKFTIVELDSAGNPAGLLRILTRDELRSHLIRHKKADPRQVDHALTVLQIHPGHCYELADISDNGESINWTVRLSMLSDRAARLIN